MKTRAGAPPGEYAAEAAALRWLGEPGGARRAGGARRDADELLRARVARAQGAARGRGAARPRAGDRARARARRVRRRAAAADRPARAARTTRSPTGRRSTPSGGCGRCSRRARPRRAGPTASQPVERVCDRIADLAGPPEPPARLHGDLWSGNVLWSGGRPFLIDPIAYGGHREVDLAMLQLFGAPGPRASSPPTRRSRRCAAGHEDRVGALPAVPAARPRGAVRRRLRRVGGARRPRKYAGRWTSGSRAGRGRDRREPRHRRRDGRPARGRGRAGAARLARRRDRRHRARRRRADRRAGARRRSTSSSTTPARASRAASTS